MLSGTRHLIITNKSFMEQSLHLQFLKLGKIRVQICRMQMHNFLHLQNEKIVYFSGFVFVLHYHLGVQHISNVCLKKIGSQLFLRDYTDLHISH